MVGNNMLEVTMGNTLRIWWAFMWRTTLFSLLFVVVIGFFSGIILSVIGKDELAGIVGGLLGYMISIPISIFVFRYILEKRFKKFSIALISNEKLP